MKKEYWDVTDEQVIDKTGKKISAWISILDKFKASEKSQMKLSHFYRRTTRYQGIGQEPSLPCMQRKAN